MNDNDKHVTFHDVEDRYLNDDLSIHSDDTFRTDKSEISEELAALETKHVNRLRAFIVIVLFVSAVAVGTVSFIFTMKAEENDFKVEFMDFAAEIDDVSHHNAKNIYGVLDNLASDITSFALFSNTQWPLFSIPHFDMLANQTMMTARTDFIAYSPLVTEQTRSSWETYAVQNQQWIVDGLQNDDILEDVSVIPPNIYNDQQSKDSNGSHYLPVWQTSPAPLDTSIVNFDLNSNPTFHELAKYILHEKTPALSDVVDITSLFHHAVPDRDGHPQSLLVQPILQDINNVYHDSSVVVGFLTLVIPWDTYFTNLLHKGANGVVIVLRDTCDDVFTYQIDGPNASFLGQGDLHDIRYDDYVFISEFEPMEGYASRHEDQGGCRYSFYIYPSGALAATYKTSTPVTITVAVVMIFLITSVCFFTYDSMVERRQERVMNDAKKLDGMVSALFPKAYRDRLLNTNLNHPITSNKWNILRLRHQKIVSELTQSLTQSPTKLIKRFLTEDRDDVTKNGSNTEEDMTTPIADLFPNATILYADVVGFTAWSSSREPSEVFILLETIYQAFDRIAKRRRVFKVETVGDCYIAVAGLPQPKADHAVIMARFARECLDKLDELISMLELKLGPDTKELGMRFGLHSGGVTAGIIRGDKSRFQLFGDTVRITGQIEKTAVKNSIQISEATAKLLKEGGKGDWIKNVGSTIHVVGKGQIKTFWLRELIHDNTISSELRNSKNVDDTQRAPTSTSSSSSSSTVFC